MTATPFPIGRRICDLGVPRGGDLLFAQTLSIRDATCGIDRLLLGNGLIPGSLTVQLDHRRLTCLRHIRAQRCTLPDVREPGDRDILAADHADAAQQECSRNQCDRCAQQPCQTFGPGDRFP